MCYYESENWAHQLCRGCGRMEVNTMNGRKLILFQGDSITDGGRMKDNHTDYNHQMGQDYAYLISAKLSLERYRDGLTFINRGISGNRISDLYARVQEDLLNLHPDMLSLLIGVNDAHFSVHENSGASPEKFERVYRLLLDEVKEALPHIKIMLLEPFVVSGVSTAPQYERWRALVDAYRLAVKRIAADYGLPLVLLQDKLDALCRESEPSYWLWDGIHPNIAGHQLIANEWLRTAEAAGIL